MSAVPYRSLVIKQFCPKDPTKTDEKLSKRSRPCVPDSQRKRVRRACESCRRRKEKCDGKIPCGRCTEEKIACKLPTPELEPAAIHLSRGERTAHLEKVVKHLLGTDSLSDSELLALSDSFGEIQPRSEPKGELVEESSLLTFARHLEHKLGGSGNLEEEENEAMGKFCRSPSPEPLARSCLLDAILAALPSKEIAEQLVRVFYTFVQCNSFMVQEEWIAKNLGKCYSRPSILSERDVPTIVTLTMILALATQFSSDMSLEKLGSTLYARATAMLPELIRLSTFESVRACLFIAVYLFPVDLPGMAYSYLGLALHIAIRNGMHKGSQQEAETRVWWTLYTMYQRARIVHGYPRTLSHRDVKVERPRPNADLEPTNRVSNFHNQVILIEITLIWEDITEDIASLRRVHSVTHIGNLLSHRRKLIDLIAKLPSIERQIQEREEANIDRLRLDIHVYLHYWHTRLSLGRPFLLSHTTQTQNEHGRPEGVAFPTDHASGQDVLSRESIDAAMKIIYLCQIIHDRIGLARASYATEFTSCRAAMLVLVASSIANQSDSISQSLAQGLTLIQQMSTGHGQASSEARVIMTLQCAIDRLHRRSSKAKTSTVQHLPQDHLRQWDLLWQHPNTEPSSPFTRTFTEADPAFNINAEHGVLPTNAVPNIAGLNDPLMFHPAAEEIWSNPFNSELDEFSLIPYLHMDFGSPAPCYIEPN